jgi:hypothetical protein
MKLTDIIVGGRYTAKVSGVITTVKVLAIREDHSWGTARSRTVHRIDVVNERTGRKTSFRSAARLRGPAPQTLSALSDAGGAAGSEVAQ